MFVAKLNWEWICIRQVTLFRQTLLTRLVLLYRPKLIACGIKFINFLLSFSLFIYLVRMSHSYYFSTEKRGGSTKWPACYLYRYFLQPQITCNVSNLFKENQWKINTEIDENECRKTVDWCIFTDVSWSEA